MAVIALVPARSGSKGVPGKNFRRLGGAPLFEHAVRCAREAGIPARYVFVSTDAEIPDEPVLDIAYNVKQRPAELAQDDTPMPAVVQHALQQIPGQPDDIIVLLQPTQPLRKPEHVQAAIALLRESGADSVVSVVALPLTHGPQMVSWIEAGRLTPYIDGCSGCGKWEYPACRQETRQFYIRDGTVYAFYRKTVDQHGTIYGQDVRPLIIPPEDTCELDTEQDWAALEARWKDRHGA
jgi:CMP-N,N'-diacetyllegionaminic acid synthase